MQVVLEVADGSAAERHAHHVHVCRQERNQEEQVVSEKYMVEEHLACYSYPNCDIDPLGCCVWGEGEEFGHKDPTTTEEEE